MEKSEVLKISSLFITTKNISDLIGKEKRRISDISYFIAWKYETTFSLGVW